MWFSLMFCCEFVYANTKAHPNLVITQQDVVAMQNAITTQGRFTAAYMAQKKRVDKLIDGDMDVPIPKDGGGGYTHEQHKKNYQAMFDAGVIFQISQENKYADFVKQMLIKYADLYPNIGLHPKRKVRSQNPGKLFWQSLNEAVWLVHTIQAYDLILETLSESEKQKIETSLLTPVVLFLSEGQPSTFNKVHNHGTWATAGVGMAGFVLDQPQWVEKALYDLDLSGKGGFIRQLDELFSPQGYYNEGPYYQRYALMPFITFASAIKNNQPNRRIFEYRDGILLKAIDTTIQLSYDGLFFPINDAIKSKGIDTIELVHGVTVAYALTKDSGFLDIAAKQSQIILSGDGLRVANALDANKDTPYQFLSTAFGDGKNGQQGAFVVLRSDLGSHQAVTFKPASQGLGHGHFDKLTWQYYENNSEIVSDYGAARFLNVEAKFGGRYLPENKSYAKQTVAHNTVVVDNKSHFNADVTIGNKNWPDLAFFETGEHGSITRGTINTAYDGVELDRTLALVDFPTHDSTLVFDIFSVDAQHSHQLDLPLHYNGQLISTSFELQSYTNNLSALGSDNGYQHLWLRGEATPTSGLQQLTWLNDNGRFYTQSLLTQGQESVLFTQLGANDPNFNLRNENSFIRRVENKKSHAFFSVLEAHGQYNPSKEFTLNATSNLSKLDYEKSGQFLLISLTFHQKNYLVVIDSGSNNDSVSHVEYQNKRYDLTSRLNVFLLN